MTLTAGEFTLTVNPVDGSEIEPHRPGTGPDPDRRPAKRDAASRAARDSAARPPALPGPPVPDRPLLERAEELERLVRLLQRGRSVRLTGPAGSGRTSLLDAVARACADLAPDGVVRLSGYGQQQPAELLHALYATVYDTAGRRPDRTALLARVREIGAIVLLDDLELGGPALDELLRATPECAYLLAATPDAKAPSDDSHLDEVFLGGLGRTGATQLLEALTGRPLTEAETAWAGDLRFASEGLPLSFVQAAALLRQRDELNGSAAAGDEDEEPGVFEERPRDPAPVPLPTLAQAAAPAALLASRVSESARAALRTACALGGELPHPAHLPALVGDTHADTAVAELLACGLISPAGPRYRLAEGVARQLEEAGYGGSGAEEARTAARHYAWWTGHSSVTPERVAAEADAVLAALAGADVVAAVLLARTAAPAFEASLHWDAWERVLRAGAEAARKAGEVAEQAYFHHELGVLALCEGRLDRARAELEASIGLRGALADKRGTVAGRRALALVTDREALGPAASPPLRLEAPPTPDPDGPTRPLPLGKPPHPAAGATAPTTPLPTAGTKARTPFPPAAGASDPTTPLPAAGAKARSPFPAVAGTNDPTTPLPAAGTNARAPFPPAARSSDPTTPLPAAGADARAAFPALGGTDTPATPLPAVGSSDPTTPLPAAGAKARAPFPSVGGASAPVTPPSAAGADARAAFSPLGGTDTPATPLPAASADARVPFPPVGRTDTPVKPLPAAGTDARAPFPPVGRAGSSAVRPSATGAKEAAAAPVAGAAASLAKSPAAAPTKRTKPAATTPARGSEAVTQVNPVIRRAQLPPPETPKNLAAVFGSAFPPPAPTRPAPPRLTGPRPAPPGPARRRRTALLGAAGVLTVAALGTVIGLALASDGTQDPEAPSVSSSPSAQVSPRVPQVPGTGGGDAVADPAPAATPGRSGSPQPGHSGGTSAAPTPSGSPSSQPPASSPAPGPSPSSSAPSPSASVSPPPSPSPSQSQSGSASSAVATPPTSGPQSPTTTTS
ncbi:ATP-binding protein [Streptomyces sp. NPDC058157]|uniref:ATP-binding protein n=1 Tax=Streptomyces sp. NPDC058157 TaxID=3346360 RepID=UPI0036E4A5F1